MFKIANAPERLEFKFVVDGNWVTSPSYPRANDGTGNINNFMLSVDYLPVKLPNLIQIRSFFNKIHQESTERNAEIFMHQQTNDIIVTTKQFDCTKSWDALVTITRLCYTGSSWESKCSELIELPGTVFEVMLVATISD
jgi:hypothetical protein